MIQFAIMCGLGFMILGSLLYIGEIAFSKSTFYRRIMNWFSPEFDDTEFDVQEFRIADTYDRIAEDGNDYVEIHRSEDGEWSVRKLKSCDSVILPEVIVGEEVVI